MTDDFSTSIEKADRLAMVAERIGIAVWRLQELEGCAAHYLVLKTKAKQGMGTEAGDELISKALKQTFGATLREITKANILEPALQKRFDKILEERNWLVHKSLASSRSALQTDDSANRLITRINCIAKESLKLLRVVGELSELFVREKGVSQQYLDERAAAILREWHQTKAE